MYALYVKHRGFFSFIEKECLDTNTVTGSLPLLVHPHLPAYQTSTANYKKSILVSTGKELITKFIAYRQIISEQLHYQGAILIGILIESVQLRNSVVESLTRRTWSSYD